MAASDYPWKNTAWPGGVLPSPYELPLPPSDFPQVHDQPALKRPFEPTISDASKQEMESGKGTKDDWGKLRYDLIPPLPLQDLAAIYTMGAKKYTDDNWMNGMGWRRPYAAIQRHLQAFMQGEDMDPESGLPHVMHAAWGCFTLAQYMRTHRDWDDRRKDWEEVRVKPVEMKEVA